jgi:hypothetical protein
MRVGLIEMREFAKDFFEGIKDETFMQESAGVADLITSCAFCPPTHLNLYLFSNVFFSLPFLQVWEDVTECALKRSSRLGRLAPCSCLLVTIPFSRVVQEIVCLTFLPPCRVVVRRTRERTLKRPKASRDCDGQGRSPLPRGPWQDG